jgi:hypothetical protein
MAISISFPGKLQGILDRKECSLFYDSLALPRRKRQGMRSLSRFFVTQGWIAPDAVKKSFF